MGRVDEILQGGLESIMAGKGTVVDILLDPLQACFNVDRRLLIARGRVFTKC